MNELVRWLPAVNASLNGLATLLLLSGYVAIKLQQLIGYSLSTRFRTSKPNFQNSLRLLQSISMFLHKSLMLSAFGTSILFLACYLVYHWALHSLTGEAGKKFTGVGVIRPIYFTILITHVILAAAVPVLALMTIYRALKQNWIGHKRIAVITFPIWVYVSVTGVIIYFLLYHWPTA